MRFRVLDATRRNLARGAAVLVLGAVSAGCSSGVARFQDGFFTGSTDNQRQILHAAEGQPYPGENMQAAQNNQNHANSSSRDAVKPVDLAAASVQRSELAPPPSATQAARAPAPSQSAPPDPAPTGAAAAPRSNGTHAGQGWSPSAGTEITVSQGETVYNLSRRFGVPADAIMAANGLSDHTSLQAGKKIKIPTYAYSATAPVSAPDNDPKVASAKPTAGTLGTLPADQAPEPSGGSGKGAAMLPQTPKLKEQEDAVQQAANAPASPKPQASGDMYTVVAGDTLFGIAKKTGASVESVKAANGLSNGLLRIGQTLTIPSAAAPSTQVASAPAKVDVVTTGTAAPEARAEPAAYTPPKKTESVIQQAALDPDEAAPDASGIGRMRWPVRGRVISGYGSSGGAKANDGIDIAVPAGTPIKAAENGVVIYAGDGLKEFGNTVLVRHEDGLVTVYGHASELKVSRGQTVRRGQEIARAGMSGSTDMPKLHFEVRKDSVPVDPKTYLE
jgi:murein DD-endopeptidase MepM/ murein hydrolase activator NlpD